MVISTIKKLKRHVITTLNRKQKYSLYEYRDADGNFDYQKYREIQQAGNKRKISHSWVTEEEVGFLSEYIKAQVDNLNFGICHGTRQGFEQKWFSEHLNGIKVIGTEISETATEFPNTVQWDFHEENQEWEGRADFIYSNSFDHSYSPEKAINTWMKTLNPGGVCIIEHSKYHYAEASNELDPFGASLDIMPYLILVWSKGKFSVREILESPATKGELGKAQYLVIKRN